MKHRNIIMLVTFAVLVFLLVFPPLYIQAVCGGYMENIEEVKNALASRDASKAKELFDENLDGWDERNDMLLSFTPHAETEAIKDSLVRLGHSIDRNEYALALERADLLYAEIHHLIEGSCLSWENIF